MPKTKLAAIAVGCAALTLGIWYIGRPGRPAQIPAAATVLRMEAHVGNSWRDRPDLPRFGVPDDHIPKIMGTLQGVVLDDSRRRSLQGLGMLWLFCDDGSVVKVSLYHSRGHGAVAIVGSGKSEGWYVGGSDTELDDAVRRAFAAQHE